LRRLGHHVTDLTGLDLESSRRATREQASEFEALVVVGGDGLIHLGLDAVAGTETALGIVPAGTGNDLARGLDLPIGDPVRSAELVSTALHAGRSRQVDAVRVSGPDGSSWFGSILASGVDALINERANSWRRPRGPARYTLAAVRELLVARPVGMRITLDGATSERECLLVAVANTRCYGGGIQMAPDADPTDGLLDVVVVDGLSRVAALQLFPKARRGAHLGIPAVHVHRARSVTLQVLPGGPQPHPYADGEPLGDLPVTCQVVPGALRVLG
jgi:diacylglycerol kinase (ATP)